MWKFSSVSSRCKRISSAHSREGAPVIFSFTLWNNCLNIACSIASSSPETRAILSTSTSTRVTEDPRVRRAPRTRVPTQQPAYSAVPRETAAGAQGRALGCRRVFQDSKLPCVGEARILESPPLALVASLSTEFELPRLTAKKRSQSLCGWT